MKLTMQKRSLSCVESSRRQSTKHSEGDVVCRMWAHGRRKQCTIEPVAELIWIGGSQIIQGLWLHSSIEDALVSTSTLVFFSSFRGLFPLPSSFSAHWWSLITEGCPTSRIVVILILLSLWLNRACSFYLSIFPGTFSDQCLSTACIGRRALMCLGHRQEKKCLSKACLEKPKSRASAKKTSAETHGPGEMGLSLTLFSMGTEEQIFSSLLSCGFLCYCCLVAQSCLTLHSTLPGSSVHGISQARILERVTISFSTESSQPRGRTCVSCIGRWILYTWAIRGALWLSLPGSYLFEKQQAEGEICPVPIFARVSPYSLWPWNLPSRVWVEP